MAAQLWHSPCRAAGALHRPGRGRWCLRRLVNVAGSFAAPQAIEQPATQQGECVTYRVNLDDIEAAQKVTILTRRLPPLSLTHPQPQRVCRPAKSYPSPPPFHPGYLFGRDQPVMVCAGISSSAIMPQGKLRLDAFLSARTTWCSRARVQDSIRSGHVAVNGTVTTKTAAGVQPGDAVAFVVYEPAPVAAVPEAGSLPVAVPPFRRPSQTMRCAPLHVAQAEAVSRVRWTQAVTLTHSLGQSLSTGFGALAVSIASRVARETQCAHSASSSDASSRSCIQRREQPRSMCRTPPVSILHEVAQASMVMVGLQHRPEPGCQRSVTFCRTSLWRSCTKTRTLWWSTRRPAWSCTRRRGTQPGRWSTQCCTTATCPPCACCPASRRRPLSTPAGAAQV